MPAIYDLANRGLLPPGLLPDRLRAPRLGRPGLRADRLRRRQGARAHAVPRGGVAPALRGLPVRAGQLRRRRGVRHPARRRSTSSTRPAAPAATTRSTSPSRRGFFGAVVGQLKEHGLAEPADSAGSLVAPGGRREAVRARPGVGPRAQRHPRRGVPVGIGLPDRPLPGQGDGPEHPGDALRQQHVRADLERQLRRPRADHHGRGHRHRRPRRLLRRHRRGPRRHPEPPAPADGAGRHGGADLLRRRAAAHGEAEGALARSSCRRGSTPRPRAGSTPPGWQGGEKVIGFLEEEGIRRTSKTETYAAITLHVDTRRWAGVPFYLRTGKRLGRRVTEVAVVFKRAPHLPFNATATEELDARTHWSSGCSPTRA